jgi:hypothetical protein
MTFDPELVFLATSDEPDEDYARRDNGPPSKLQNSHPDATAAWLLLVLRCIESGLSPAKDSSIQVISEYLKHYIKSLSHVQLECRLSEQDEKFLLKTFWRDYCPRLGFLGDGTVHTSIPSPPSFVIPEKLRNCQQLLRLVTFSPVDDGPIRFGRQRKRKTLWCLRFYCRCAFIHAPLIQFCRYRRPVPTSLDGCADFNDCVACMNLLWTVLSDRQRQSDDLLQGQVIFQNHAKIQMIDPNK